MRPLCAHVNLKNKNKINLIWVRISIFNDFTKMAAFGHLGNTYSKSTIEVSILTNFIMTNKLIPGCFFSSSSSSSFFLFKFGHLQPEIQDGRHFTYNNMLKQGYLLVRGILSTFIYKKYVSTRGIIM